MAPQLISLIAVVSVALCVFLWFRDVRRIMGERKSTVESAAGQLAAWREKARRAPSEPDTAAVIERSESIYRQAVELYDQALRRPWNYLPARLMGFHRISSRDFPNGDTERE